MVGNWNVAILSPDWIKQNVSILADTTPEIQLQPFSNKIRMNMEGVYITPESNKLTVAPTLPDEEIFKRIDIIASNIYSNLKHTPVGAVGYNYQYKLADNEKFSLNIDVCGEECRDLYSKLGGTFQDKLSLAHCVEFKEENLMLNISYEVNEEKSQVLNLNYHYLVDRDQGKTQGALNKFFSNYKKSLEVSDCLIEVKK